MSSPNASNAQRLQDDRGLRRPKYWAGAISLVMLVGLFVTSLSRSPNPVFSVAVAVVAVTLLAAIAIGAWRRRHRFSGVH
ncbi:hypothetical protein ACVGOW_22400 [Pseudonocardia saturnea]